MSKPTAEYQEFNSVESSKIRGMELTQADRRSMESTSMTVTMCHFCASDSISDAINLIISVCYARPAIRLSALCFVFFIINIYIITQSDISSELVFSGPPLEP